MMKSEDDNIDSGKDDDDDCGGDAIGLRCDHLQDNDGRMSMFKHCIWFTLTKMNHVKEHETATRVVLMYTIHTCPRSSALIIPKY